MALARTKSEFLDLPGHATTEELAEAVRAGMLTTLRLSIRRNPGCCQRCIDNKNLLELPVHPNCKCIAEYLHYGPGTEPVMF